MKCEIPHVPRPYSPDLADPAARRADLLTLENEHRENDRQVPNDVPHPAARRDPIPLTLCRPRADLEPLRGPPGQADGDPDGDQDVLPGAREALPPRRHEPAGIRRPRLHRDP